ncbi:RNA 2'-phosphotransferase [Paenibacillus sp. NRS-1781]|uniref:RNA 2'-phosphotransferase n=1 Tax=unclassified Paenibacillus TaxID=185978 RepID=UPI003D28E7E2
MNYKELSKEVSYILRHAPWEYELEIVEQGWVSVSELIESLSKQAIWHDICENDLKQMIDLSEKKRHEMSNGMIRAMYGHSLSKKIVKEPCKPPKYLFHGTSNALLNEIKKQGLLPMGRQYVHLSDDINTAMVVGKRKSTHPKILKVYADKAWNEGLTFYHGNDKVWLSNAIPSQYIDLI